MQHLKSLGSKAYGHIPHLPGSRLGSGDHTIEPGQIHSANHATRRICTPDGPCHQSE